MEEFKVPGSEILARQGKIQQEMQRREIDGILVGQRIDLFYFTGTAQNGYLYIPAAGEPLLYIKKYLPRAIKESPVKRIVEIGSLKEIPGLITDFYGTLPAVLGLEFDVLPVRQFHYYEK
ncbi:MAG: aminopeptidase P family N-terminal domain-containing protein, partial [Syntrophales bacterium LBB04]|nr:aminopeptidase P family N-terminal domain-containing protein [Syntrophales bacterium LBB04]